MNEHSRKIETIRAKAEAYLRANPPKGPAKFNKPHDYRVQIWGKIN